jgi:hypothetical protein
MKDLKLHSYWKSAAASSNVQAKMDHLFNTFDFNFAADLGNNILISSYGMYTLQFGHFVNIKIALLLK